MKLNDQQIEAIVSLLSLLEDGSHALLQMTDEDIELETLRYILQHNDDSE